MIFFAILWLIFYSEPPTKLKIAITPKNFVIRWGDRFRWEETLIMGTPSYKTLPKTLKLEIVDAAKICAQMVFHFLKTRENTCGKQGGGSE